VAISVLNDLLFTLFKDTYGIYLTDYAAKLLMLLLVLMVWRTLPPAPSNRLSVWTFPLLWLGLVVFSQAIEPLSVFLGQGWQLFRWPFIENPWLWWLDLSLGLILVATVEEMVDRRLALAVLPGPMWGRLVVSSLLFGLAHWGQGYGHMAETAVFGLVFGLVYLWTGSLKLVIAAHYAVDFLVFGMGKGEL